MARTAVSETFQSLGSVPSTNASAGLPSTAASVKSAYVSDMQISTGGVITVTVNNTNAADVDGKFLVLHPYENTGGALATGYSGPIDWKCVGSTVPNKYLPAACRTP